MDIAETAVELLAKVTAGLPNGGEQRAGQQEMTAVVATALANDGHVVVQAGTGTGKSLAYLAPIAVTDQKVVVATATKALQDQLAGKDLPLLSSRLDEPLEFAVLKGRSNYLCMQRLKEAESEKSISLTLAQEGLDADDLKKLRSFADKSASGDRSELSDISDSTWQQVSVSRHECPGASRCAAGDECFAEHAWRRAAAADVLIVNLHLYAIDIAVGDILPDHDIVIIDEAHQLEEIISDTAGRYLSPTRLTTAAAAVRAVVADSTASRQVNEAAKMLTNELSDLIGRRLRKGPSTELADTLDLISGRVDKLLTELRLVPDDAPMEVSNRAIRARQSVSSLLEDIRLLRSVHEDEVLWVDGPDHNPSLRSTPLEIHKILARNLWGQRGGILTSATMPADATRRFGLPESAVETDVGSPFDYETNALLYCAADLPNPSATQFRNSQHEEMEALINAAGGRTLALFTSWTAMTEAATRISARVRWPVLTQGERSKAQLLEDFIGDHETCLFATMSFWQGIDAVGSTCNLVIIDRIPFPRPDDPVLQARRERVGANAFQVVDVPKAATLLAQGAGRLIRSATDRGVVAVLDPRLATSRGYRWQLLNALPPMRRTKDRSEAITLLETLNNCG